MKLLQWFVEERRLTLRRAWLATAGTSQTTIMSKVKRRNFLSARWPVTPTESESALKQQYSRKFLANREGCFKDSDASCLKLSLRSFAETPSILTSRKTLAVRYVLLKHTHRIREMEGDVLGTPADNDIGNRRELRDPVGASRRGSSQLLDFFVEGALFAEEPFERRVFNQAFQHIQGFVSRH